MKGAMALLLAAGVGMALGVDLDSPVHQYWRAELNDRLSQMKADFESGRIVVDVSSELAAVRSVLSALDVPESSQMLVFSATSLQQAIISPENPRALYFNEEVYVGWVPGGKLEIASIDPALGAIFYLFPFPREGRPPVLTRSTRCINCHVNEDTRGVPGLVVKSVVPGPNGGSLMAFRKEQSGHGVPLAERFGGWYVTGRHGVATHWGNLTGRLNAGALTKYPLDPSRTFDMTRYPVPTSDILPQLLHEHQAGFDNRFAEAIYRTRELLAQGPPSGERALALDALAASLVKYLLFAEEVPLPAGGVEGEAAFRTAFLRNRRPGPDGASLKDFDLRTRLFRHRCSYMIYSPLFTGMPATLKNRVYLRLAVALNTAQPDAEYAYLPAGEKAAIRAILRATLRDLPPGF